MHLLIIIVYFKAFYKNDEYGFIYIILKLNDKNIKMS